MSTIKPTSYRPKSLYTYGITLYTHDISPLIVLYQPFYLSILRNRKLRTRTYSLKTYKSQRCSVTVFRINIPKAGRIGIPQGLTEIRYAVLLPHSHTHTTTSTKARQVKNRESEFLYTEMSISFQRSWQNFFLEITWNLRWKPNQNTNFKTWCDNASIICCFRARLKFLVQNWNFSKKQTKLAHRIDLQWNWIESNILRLSLSRPQTTGTMLQCRTWCERFRRIIGIFILWYCYSYNWMQL